METTQESSPSVLIENKKKWPIDNKQMELRDYKDIIRGFLHKPEDLKKYSMNRDKGHLQRKLEDAREQIPNKYETESESDFDDAPPLIRVITDQEEVFVYRKYIKTVA
jgi:hypothetical protein